MRTYEMKDGVLTCIVETHSYAGSLQYDFNEGEFVAHKPANMSTYDWCWYVLEFTRLCVSMVKPKPSRGEI